MPDRSGRKHCVFYRELTFRSVSHLFSKNLLADPPCSSLPHTMAGSTICTLCTLCTLLVDADVTVQVLCRADGVEG